MPTNFDNAYTAIEGVVAVRHAADSDNWSAIVPMDAKSGWGLTLARWSTEARQMVAAFNALITPKSVVVSNTVIVNAGNQALDQFQTYLGDEADQQV